MRFARLALLLIVGVVAPGGCGGNGGAVTPTPIPSDEASGAPFSLTFGEYESDFLGYRIEVPEGWAYEPAEVGGVSADTFQAGEPIDGERPNMTVLKTSAAGQTVEQVLSAEEAAAAQEDGLVVAGHNAVRVDITKESQGVLLDFAQVFVVIDDTTWTLTFVVEAGNRDRFLPIFDHIYQSFQTTG